MAKSKVAYTKVPHSGKGKAPPHWLEMRKGTFGTSYRIRYRRDGIKLEQALEGDFKDWTDARDVGEALIAKTKYGEKPKAKNLVTSESLCDEIVKLKEHLDSDTYKQTETFMRLHIKPFMRGECAYENDGGTFKACAHRSFLESGSCPYAADLNPTKWLAYKAHYRLHRPDGALFNHFKFFQMLVKYAFDKQVLTAKFKLPYDEEKEDFREKGLVMSDDDLRAMVKHANRTWRDRILLGRMLGQRPGLIRDLRKDQVDFETGICTVEKTDSKNRRYYSFILPAPALEILRARLSEVTRVANSPYFFPMETDPSRPMDKHLGGWNSARKRAGVEAHYTPHDLRHTHLTHKFKTAKNPALVCYACDLSLEEAMATYIHFEAADTRVLAEETSEDASSWTNGKGGEIK